jgi:hypothetical protein
MTPMAHASTTAGCKSSASSTSIGLILAPSWTMMFFCRPTKIAPKLAVFGHLHPAHGVYRLNDTVLANVTLVNEKYQAVHGVWEYELAE